MAKDWSQEELQRLARLGAQARLAQIEFERRAILEMFPDLAPPRRGRRPGRPQASRGTTVAQAKAKPRRRRRKMSAADRKAVSDRMKKYWAERRKSKS